MEQNQPLSAFEDFSFQIIEIIKMQVNVQTPSTESIRFMTPQEMLKGLVTAMDHPCNCGLQPEGCECEEDELNEQIKTLQTQASNIRSQIVEVERMLQARDHLYSELDQLRLQRDQIEHQISTCAVVDQTETVKCSGYREMNQRLRRRIYEVRQYIQKMTFENQRIEEGIISNQYVQQEEEILLKRREMVSQAPVYQGKRHYSGNLDVMIEKMHDRQEQAWRRVRRQQEEINRRNIQSRMRKTGGMTYYSPKSRTYFSPQREIY